MDETIIQFSVSKSDIKEEITNGSLLNNLGQISKVDFGKNLAWLKTFYK